MDEMLLHATATELVKMLRQKHVTAEELASFYLSRIENYDRAADLNSVAALNPRALDEARRIDALPDEQKGVLAGLPMLIKDNIDVAGMRTAAGSVALADNIASADAPVVAALRRAGAVILGKSNMTEFANYMTQNMPNGFSSLGGQVKNAYDRAKDPSGSSTGSGVAVSARLCPAALGTDTSFSIVGCASENGVTGYKPPHGAINCERVVPISHTLDMVGPMTQTLGDALLIYSAMLGRAVEVAPAAPEKIRLAVNTAGREKANADRLAMLERVLGALRRKGGTVIEVIQETAPQMRDIMRYEFRHDLDKYLSGTYAKRKTLAEIVAFYNANPQHMPHGMTNLLAALEVASGNMDESEYLAAIAERERRRAEMTEQLRDVDAVMMTGYNSVMHFAGFPSVALRLGLGENGHPHGVILYGPDEKRLLAAALTLEKYCAPLPMPEL